MTTRVRFNSNKSAAGARTTRAYVTSARGDIPRAKTSAAAAASTRLLTQSPLFSVGHMLKLVIRA
jgi:hypothetical protein